MDAGGKYVVVRSLLWPGFSAFHSPSSGEYGNVYFGSGLRNHDIGYNL
jgi:radial spoke head protein 9